MNTEHEELTIITQNIFNYAEQSTDEIREQVSHRFSLMTQKSGGDNTEMKNNLLKYADKQRQAAIAESNNEMTKTMENLRTELK